MKLRTAHILITGLVICLTAAVGTAYAAIDAVTILRNMLDAEGKASFTAYQVTTISKGPSVTSEQIVYRRGFSGMRMEYVSPAGLKGEVMADDGKVGAHLIPRRKVLRLVPSRLAVLRQRTEQAEQSVARKQLRVDLVGKDRIAGQAAYVLVVKPRRADQGPTRKFWIDTDKWVKLKTEDIAPNGTVVSTSYYTRIQYLNDIPDSKFRIDAPDGYRVERDQGPRGLLPLDKARKMVRFKIVEPDYIPPGFRLVGAAVEPFRGSHIIGLRYTNNVSSFSLFQTPEKSLNPRFMERLNEGPVRPGRGVYSWKRGPLNLTLVGGLPSDQIKRIADSIK